MPWAKYIESDEGLKADRAHWFLQETPRDRLNKAFVANDLTVRGRIVRDLGEDQALLWAQKYGHKTLASMAKGVEPADPTAPPPEPPKASNPFTIQGWSLKRQGELYNVNPGLCASQARAAGVTIGATKGVM